MINIAPNYAKHLISARAIGLYLFIFLSGCASQPAHNGISKPINTLYEKTTWQAKGKFAIRHNGKSQSVNFVWKQKKNDFEIHLYGPLGQGSAYIRHKDGGYELESKKGTTTASSAEELLYKVNGWHLPVSNLLYWLKGLPAPDVPLDNHEIKDNGVYKSLYQDGWEINYTTHQWIKGYLLPKKLKAHRENLKLTLNIKSWKL